MGYGDELIASGLARGAAARGRRVAFGDGRFISWSKASHEIFAGNPNVAPPGSERAADLEWVRHYRGHRLYGHVEGGHWKFHDFTCPPGEVFFDATEQGIACELPQGYVVIEPRVKPWGACDGRNKQWPVERYNQLAVMLKELGHEVVQIAPKGQQPLCPQAHTLFTETFRRAMLVLGRASLYVGPEGGLHHAAAALGIPAVVIFGGFNSPKATGYAWHANLVAAGEPCGSIAHCAHCERAMASITIEQVLAAATIQLESNQRRRAS